MSTDLAGRRVAGTQHPWVGLVILAAVLFLAAPCWSRDDTAAAVQPLAQADTRGFVDVWQLRRDVAAVELLETTDDTDSCFPEGDPDAVPTDRDIKSGERETAACVAKIHANYAAYQKVGKAFNAAWLPVMRAAIARGDAVAEVIMRLCDTTSVLDRSGIESTCDTTEPRRAVARARLKKIGFGPALDLHGELAMEQGPGALPGAQEFNQALLLSRVRSGALDLSRGGFGIPTGNIARNPSDVRTSLRWAVIEAATQDAPRAFTFSPGSTEAGWGTSVFSTLRLNRKPLTPGFLTWGPALHYGGGNTLYTGPHYWRAQPRRIRDESVAGGTALVMGTGNVQFEHDREQLLTEIETNIARYLAEDPRWGVFLLHRVGHHEWEPEGTQSATRLLSPAWEGSWALEKETGDWTSPMKSANGHAVIERSGQDFQVTVAADHPEDPFLNVEQCTLRYSGASTYRPESGPGGQSPGGTVFGSVAYPEQVAGGFTKEGANKEAVAPLDPAKRYSQVLMLCANGESLDSARVRFLLLAGDTLLEVGARDPFRGALSVRHYRRARP